MYVDIQNATIAYNDEDLEIVQGKWFGMFSMLDILLGVRAVLNDGNLLFFNVLSNGRLEETSIEDDVLQMATAKRIRVVMHFDTKWHIDPSPDDFKSSWEVWAYGKCPLAQLRWDLGDDMWQDPLAPQKEISFFPKLVRHLLLDKKRSSISSYHFWMDQGIAEQDISIFWKMFWEVEIARKISMFHWLVMHHAVPVKQCLKIPLLNTLCLECKLMEESIRHCLWDCCHAKLTWLRILRILQINGLNMNVSWGSVVWMSLKENAFAYDSRLGVMDAI